MRTIDEDRNRVSIEALEFDWIFTDNNAENLITVLSNLNNLEILSTKPLTMFINFMWSHYQPAIIRKIFIPYIMYMFTFLYLTSGVISEVIERDYDDDE